ncbi:MAG: flagellar hook-length control protein FliK [Rhodobacteraceae bacterium]|nr:flagellar hook-length control protein FliK [Paracoccaceae bacterium]
MDLIPVTDPSRGKATPRGAVAPEEEAPVAVAGFLAAFAANDAGSRESPISALAEGEGSPEGAVAGGKTRKDTCPSPADEVSKSGESFTAVAWAVGLPTTVPEGKSPTEVPPTDDTVAGVVPGRQDVEAPQPRPYSSKAEPHPSLQPQGRMPEIAGTPRYPDQAEAAVDTREGTGHPRPDSARATAAAMPEPVPDLAGTSRIAEVRDLPGAESAPDQGIAPKASARSAPPDPAEATAPVPDITSWASVPQAARPRPEDDRARPVFPPAEYREKPAEGARPADGATVAAGREIDVRILRSDPTAPSSPSQLAAQAAPAVKASAGAQREDVRAETPASGASLLSNTPGESASRSAPAKQNGGMIASPGAIPSPPRAGPGASATQGTETAAPRQITVAAANVPGPGPAAPPDALPPARIATDTAPAIDAPESGAPVVLQGLHQHALPQTPHSAPIHPGAPDSALPPGTGHRLAEAVAQFPDRPVEVTLTPEELGRVRMTLTAQDAGLVMTVEADRRETLDLLRRHIESLAQDFRDLGFRDVDFRFSGGGHPQGGQDQSTLPSSAPDPSGTPSPETIAEAQPAPRTRHNAASPGGLDLRL